MPKGLGLLIAQIQYLAEEAPSLRMLPKESQQPARLQHIKTPSRAYRAEISRHKSLRCAIYIMHKERNATAQQENRRRRRHIQQPERSEVLRAGACQMIIDLPECDW